MVNHNSVFVRAFVRVVTHVFLAYRLINYRMHTVDALTSTCCSLLCLKNTNICSDDQNTRVSNKVALDVKICIFVFEETVLPECGDILIALEDISITCS